MQGVQCMQGSNAYRVPMHVGDPMHAGGPVPTGGPMYAGGNVYILYTWHSDYGQLQSTVNWVSANWLLNTYICCDSSRKYLHPPHKRKLEIAMG